MTVFGFADASYQAAGQIAGVRQLVDEFYRLMDSVPEAATIRAMHPTDLTISRDKLTYFLTGWLGGPREFNDHYGPINIPGVHRHLSIGYAERDAWLNCMAKAIELQPYSAEFKLYLLQQLAIPAERVRVTSQGE